MPTYTSMMQMAYPIPFSIGQIFSHSDRQPHLHTVLYITVRVIMETRHLWNWPRHSSM